MDEKVLEEIKFHQETIATDANSPLHLIREKEIEISGRVLAAKREADEIVADARKKAAEIVARPRRRAARLRAKRRSRSWPRPRARSRRSAQRQRAEVASSRRRSRAARSRRRVGARARHVESDERQASARATDGGCGTRAGPDGEGRDHRPEEPVLRRGEPLHEQGTLHIEDLSKKIQPGEVPLDRWRSSRQRQADDGSGWRTAHSRARDPQGAARAGGARRRRRAQARSTSGSGRWTPRSWRTRSADVIDEVEDRTAALLALAHLSSRPSSRCSRATSRSSQDPAARKQIVTTGAFDSVALLVERRYKGALEQLKEELDKLTQQPVRDRLHRRRRGHHGGDRRVQPGSTPSRSTSSSPWRT